MSNYWEKRIANNTWTTYNNIEEENRALLEMYQQATLDIQNELYTITQKINGGKNVTLSDMHKYNRLSQMQKSMENTIKELTENIETYGTNKMVNAGKEVYKNVMSNIADTSFSVPNERVMKEMLNRPWTCDTGVNKSTFSKRIWKNAQTLSMNLNDILVIGLTQGKTITELAIQLGNRMNKDFNVCHRLVRTETMHYLNESSFRAYEDGGCEEVELWAAKDERTCDVCGAMHGKKYKLKERPILPLHANCRCTYIPVVDLKNKKDDNKIEFTEAKNIKGANEFAKNILGINAEYKGLDILTANEWNRGLADSINRFPKLKENFGFVGECRELNKSLKTDLIEYYFSEYKRLNPGFNEEALHEEAKKKASTFIRKHMKVGKNAFAQSWSPKQELHYPYRGVTVNKDWGKNSKMFIERLKANVETKFHPEGCDTIRSVLDHEVGHQLDSLLNIRELPEIQEIFNSRTTEQITNDISRYSWKNKNPDKYSEMIAEAWSEYCNNPKPRGPAKKIGEIIEREYKKKYGGI